MNAYPWHAQPLARLLGDRSRLPHALLVHGRAGIGKAEFVRALAAGVLCESPRDGLACGGCESCHWFSQGNHPDYREVVPEADAPEEDDAESDGGKTQARAKSVVIKIEQIRDIADFIALSTHRAGYRVLVLRPAEAMQPAAANALLKTLEEPPPATLIVLVADQPSRLLATIRSRCRHLELGVPATGAAIEWLRGLGVAEPETVLALSGGAPLFARDLAEPSELELRRRIVAELARPGGAHPVAFAAALDRPALERFLYWMQTWVHDLLRARLAGGVRHHRDQAGAISARARRSNVAALFALERELIAARRLASHPLNPRLVAESLLLAYNRATSEARP